MTESRQDSALGADERAPDLAAVRHDPAYASKLPPTALHRALDRLASSAAWVWFGVQAGAQAAMRVPVAVVMAPMTLAEAGVSLARQAAGRRQARQREALVQALAMIGMPLQRLAALDWEAKCRRQWAEARRRVQALCGIDVGPMPRDWPAARALEDGRDLALQGEVEMGRDPGALADPIAVEAKAVEQALRAKGYGAQMLGSDGLEAVVATDAPDAMVQAAVEETLGDLGPAPGTEPRLPGTADSRPTLPVGTVSQRALAAVASALGVAPREDAPIRYVGADDARAQEAGLIVPGCEGQEDEQTEADAVAEVTMGALAQAQKGPEGKSEGESVQAPVQAIPETSGQAALRELGPICAIEAVGEISREMGQPLVITSTEAGGTSMAPLTDAGIVDTARAMATDAGVAGMARMDGDQLVASRAPTGDGSPEAVAMTALTLAAGAFTLRPSESTARAWRRQAKGAAKLGLIMPDEVAMARMETAEYIPQTGQVGHKRRLAKEATVPLGPGPGK